jgi:hypothetical protein
MYALTIIVSLVFSGIFFPRYKLNNPRSSNRQFIFPLRIHENLYYIDVSNICVDIVFENIQRQRCTIVYASNSHSIQ